MTTSAWCGRASLSFSLASRPNEETVNPISTLNRREQYEIAADTKKDRDKKKKLNIGFKIDIRLNYHQDCHQYSCIDLCAGEAAKEEDKGKTTADQCKVVCKVKSNLDVLLSVLANSPNSCVGWSSGWFDMLHLLSVPRCKWALREYSQKRGIIFGRQGPDRAIEAWLGRHNSNQHKFTPKMFWKRDTYYTPPADMKSVVPKHLFGFPTVQSILEKVKKDMAASNVVAIAAEIDDDNKDNTDEFGWLKQGSKWCNVYTKRYNATYPLYLL